MSRRDCPFRALAHVVTWLEPPPGVGSNKSSSQPAESRGRVYYTNMLVVRKPLLWMLFEKPRSPPLGFCRCWMQMRGGVLESDCKKVDLRPSKWLRLMQIVIVDPLRNHLYTIEYVIIYEHLQAQLGLYVEQFEISIVGAICNFNIETIASPNPQASRRQM